jgi:hypothetical protein
MLIWVPVVREYTVDVRLHHSAFTEQMMVTRHGAAGGQRPPRSRR